MIVQNNTAAPTFLKDEEVRRFSSQDEMKNFLSERERTDRWEQTPANYLKVIGVENAAHMVRTMGTAVLPSPMEGYAGTEEGLAETMEELGYLVSYYDTVAEGWRTYPLRSTGWSSLWDRSKGGCGKVRDADSPKALPPEVRAKWLSDCLSSEGDTPTKVLVRDGKVGAVFSGRYQPISAEELLRVTMEKLPEESRFMSGTIDHEITVADVGYGGEEGDAELKDKLESLGITCNDVYRVARFSTSDVGDSAATIEPLIMIDGKEYYMGTALKMPHKGAPSTQKWEQKLSVVSALLNETTETLEKLAAVNIQNAAGCFRYCACELGLSKPVSLRLAKDFESAHPSGCTALDVYRELIEVVETIETAGGKTPSPATRIRNRENVARALKFNYKLYDIEFEWQ